MRNPHEKSFFDNLHTYRKDELALRQDQTNHPKDFEVRQNEVRQAKAKFLEELKKLPLRTPLKIDMLVTNTFDLGWKRD